MSSNSLLGPWVRRFLLEHLVGERDLSPNTRRSYRDTMILLLPYASEQLRHAVDRLEVTDLSADVVRNFLEHLEKDRHSATATRNQRLAAIHAFARFVGEHCPELAAWCGQIRLIPYKRAGRPGVGYLDKAEMDALLASPDRTSLQGRRDHALILFLYNSGARADEAARLLIDDVSLSSASVRILGKGGRVRHCPIWPATVLELQALIRDRAGDAHVFLHRRGEPITRFGIHTLVERHARAARIRLPSLAKKRVSPHTVRHTTACHLVRARVDINTIRGWLGHVSLAAC